MKNNKSIIDKLTALWALNESGLGGFLHVFNSPFTGILVGGIAILLLSLIAYYAENKGKAILKALLIVLIIKAAVSPHSPLPAYIAVSFQAVFAAFLFSFFSWKGITLMILGIVTFLQSAAQKLILLTLVYGESLWEAIDLYGAWLMERIGYTTAPSATLLLIIAYLSMYGISGLLAGLFIKSIIKLVSQQDAVAQFSLPFHQMFPKKKQNKKSFRYKVFLIWGITMAIILLIFAFFGGPSSGWQKALYIILRSLLVLMLWYLLIGPFLVKNIRRYLQKKGSEYQEDIDNAMDLFPYFRSIIAYTWKSTRHLKGYNRFKHFTAYTILYCIHFKIRPE